jgi:hypothetical protein
VAKIQDIDIPYLEFGEAAAPGTPAASVSRIYVKSDGLFYSKDDAGAETLMSSGAVGTVATDAIWDAAGDLAVGSGANTAAKLTIGAAGGALSRINGAVAWNSGTSNPGSAAAGDRYWRTDLGLEIYYDGTRWLTVDIYDWQINLNDAGTSVTFSPAFYPLFNGGVDLWLVDFRWTYAVATTHSAVHYWAAVLHKFKTGTDTTVSTLTSDKSSVATWLNPAANSIGALVGTDQTMLYVQLVKTSSPGILTCGVVVRYRRVVA